MKNVILRHMDGQSLYVCLLESCGKLDGAVNVVLKQRRCVCVVLWLMSTDRPQNPAPVVGHL